MIQEIKTTIIEKPKIEKEVPSKGLKKLVKETCESLIKQKKITEVSNETKKKRPISSLIVEELKKNNYVITKKNENTINDYFRKFELRIIKEKSGNLVVEDNHTAR